MEIQIYPIRSVLKGSSAFISADSEKLLKALNEASGDTFSLISLEELKHATHPLILVQSGGSEGFFLRDIYPVYDGPYYLLTYGSSNSLAASLEILTFVKEKNKKGEVLHGDIDYIVNRIHELFSQPSKEKPHRLGVFGEPSDWLISSHVDYQKAKDILNIELVDVPEEEVIAKIKEHQEEGHEKFNASFDEKELTKAYQIYSALKDLAKEHHLEGYTLRCFDIIGAVHMSACLGLALCNKEDIVATCEGDVPAMITAYLIQKRLDQHAFQANPQWIDPKENTISLAHCTYPLDMADEYHFETHFESGIGLGIHGKMRQGDCTIVKISADLTEFYCEEGVILENEHREDRCRTQIVVKLNNPVTYFLRSSLGNHHQVIYGHHEKELKAYFESFGLRQIKA